MPRNSNHKNETVLRLNLFYLILRKHINLLYILKNLLNNRYFEVLNISPDMYGRIPYFDNRTSKIVFYDEHQQLFFETPYDIQP